jgi:hypothetical protein
MVQEWFVNLKQIDWLDTAKVVGISSVVSSVVAIGWSALKDAGARKRQRRDTALDVAVSLESYARSCRSMMHRAEWATEKAARTHSYDAIRDVKLPEFAFPEKIEWKWLKHKVTSELREFPAAIHAGREYLGSVREYSDPAEICEAVAFECARAAKEALTLARATRRKHGAAPWKPGAKDSNLERELSDFITRSEQQRKTLRERHKQFMTELVAETELVEQK